MDLSKKLILPKPQQALPGRQQAIQIQSPHAVNGSAMHGPLPAGTESIQLAMGCFWGVEKMFWELPGVVNTAVGYAGGFTENPSYEEVCSGQTGHTEVVRVVFDPAQITLQALLKQFWEGHVPTMGMRQGNDVGTQYRSAIYVDNPAHLSEVEKSFAAYQVSLWGAGAGGITTEIKTNQTFYFAEEYHQQYLAKNPGGYCNHLDIGKTGFPEYST